MISKPSTVFRILRVCAAVITSAAILLGASACSGQQALEETTLPSSTETLTPTPEAVVTPAPTASPTPTPPPTPSPTPNVSYPLLETSDTGTYAFPQAVADKTAAMTNEPVYFKIVTSDKVKSIQTMIDGDTGKIYTEYEENSGLRVWYARVCFTKGGNRKVQFKCAMASGGTATVPKTPIKINVTFDYTAESTSKTITSGKTVTFTLKTPDTIDSVYVLVDGVNQKIKYDKPSSDEDGVKVWKINVTFFNLGTREVTFEAHDGSKVIKTFPEKGITIIVE